MRYIASGTNIKEFVRILSGLKSDLGFPVFFESFFRRCWRQQLGDSICFVEAVQYHRVEPVYDDHGSNHREASKTDPRERMEVHRRANDRRLIFPRYYGHSADGESLEGHQ